MRINMGLPFEFRRKARLLVDILINIISKKERFKKSEKFGGF